MPSFTPHIAPSNLAGSEPRVAVAWSAGIRSIRHLCAFLNLDEIVSPVQMRRRESVPDVVLVWGRKDNARTALEWARENQVPVWFLEDGWIRSSSQDAHTRNCYSLIIDREGVYYDSTTPSGIESFLNRQADEFSRDVDAAALKYAEQCRRTLVEHNITKYNYCRTPVIDLSDERSLVLVVDQTLDDASVRFGGMDQQRFIDMLTAAIAENSAARIVVRTHPDVVAGIKQGYLSEAAAKLGIEVLAGDDNPLIWLKHASRIYVGTSQLGYEALLCERPVSVFGQPFYAGWGLTDDRQMHPRRSADRCIDELFHVTHVEFARYRSPMNGERWQLHECLAHVALQKSEFSRNARRFHGIGITAWKRRYISQFLRSPDGSLSFGGTDNAASSGADTLITWGFRRFAQDDSDSAGLPVWRIEDGFLRSTGLGSDFTAPGSLVIDGQGLYFDPAAVSDLETLLNHHDCSPSDVTRASRLRRRILGAGISKYNVGQAGKPFARPADRLCVLVTGQVEDDESILRGCADITTNAALLQATRKARPDAWIVYRPHPDVEAGNRKGRVDPFTLQSCADEIDIGTSISDCIDACDELHTMTSLSGFEALLRQRKVVTYGAPFYAGWGLTEDHHVLERRSRARTLDELVYLTLIVYPRYLDIASGEFITAEDMIATIERQKLEAMNKNNNKTGWSGRQLNKLVNVVKGLRYAP